MSSSYSSGQYKVKWRKCRLETYKFLRCTVLATVPCHMALKLPWGIYFLERVGVLLLSLTSEKLFSIYFFYLNIAEIDSITTHLQFWIKKIHDKRLFNKNNAHVESTCCTGLTTVSYHDRGDLLSNFKSVQKYYRSKLVKIL